MNIILLSGGSGKRLWPLSNDVRSKQFIKIFKREDGTYESMVQRMYRMIKTVEPDSTVTIATAATQVSAINNQLSDKVGISVEPARRDTFPAIALASMYLHDVMKVGRDEPVVVCPVDPFVEEDYFKCIQKLGKLAATSSANLCLMGMEPTYPSEKYGYIMPVSKDEISTVSSFKEKPDAKTAEKYIAEGALWNGGVFAYRLGFVMDRAHELIDFDDYYDLFDKYETLDKISFDYAVVEKEDNIEVLRFHGIWKDLGTWNTLTESMEDNSLGDAILGSKCENVHILNELDLPILAMGLQNVVIAASPDGILVSDKSESSYMKPYVDGLDRDVMYAEKSWGSYKVISVSKESLIVNVTLNAGHSMNYHMHKLRNEVWTVTGGKGYTIVDGMKQDVKAGDVITIQAGCKHTIVANTDMTVCEVQLGKEIKADDKYIFPIE